MRLLQQSTLIAFSLPVIQQGEVEVLLVACCLVLPHGTTECLAAVLGLPCRVVDMVGSLSVDHGHIAQRAVRIAAVDKVTVAWYGNTVAYAGLGCLTVVQEATQAWSLSYTLTHALML